MTNKSLQEIIAAIHALSPGERRKLYRRLRVGGLLNEDELMTDGDRLTVAPALGTRLSQWQNLRPKPPVGDSPEPASSLIQPLERQSSILGASSTSPEAVYQSPVSGHVVVGAPADMDRGNGAHAMAPLPGQAPDQPIRIVFDGGSKGNPGKGYGSYAVDWPGLPQQVVRLKFGDQVTNNEAEYDTLIAALRAILKRLLDAQADPGSARLTMHGDSQLVIKQVTGEYKCNEPRLRMRRDRVQELLCQFGSWELLHHRREKSVEVLGH